MVPLVSEDINIVTGVPCHFPVLLVLLPQMAKKRSETSLKLSNTEGERKCLDAMTRPANCM